MLRVRIELWPNGDGRRARTLHTLDIWNESDLAPVSDYGFHAWSDNAGEKSGRITGHRRADGAWRLVRKIISNASL